MTLVYFLIVIGILVFVHEFGHFIMAKWAGVRVEKFSLGMGPKLAGFKWGDTEYVVSWLPLGGFVKMAGENPDEEPTGASDEFQSKPVWQRAVIAATGPLTNIALAFVIAPLIFLAGTYTLGAARVGLVEPGSPAEHAGIKAGDVIERMNGSVVTDWEKVEMLIAVNPDTDISVVVDRKGERRALTLRPKLDPEQHVGDAGIAPAIPVVVGGVLKGMPASASGLRTNDQITAVDGKPIAYWHQFSTLIRKSRGRTLTLTVLRGTETKTLTVTPVRSHGRYLVGVEPQIKLEFHRYGLADSLRLGFDKTLEFIDITFLTLKKLVLLQLSIKTLGGPVMIAELSGKAAAAGFSSFLSLLAMISISLGILNLLPIPVLDGGLLLFLAIEAVRGKPLSRAVMERAQSIGAAVLITLIAVVSYNDVMRVFFSK